MDWNYRIVREYYRCPESGQQRACLSMSQVEYNASGMPCAMAAAVHIVVLEDENPEPIEALRILIDKQVVALALPILDTRADFKDSTSELAS